MSIVIISGSRTITDYELFCNIVAKSGFNITEIVEGECGNGVDQLAIRFAHEHSIPISAFPADWNNTKHDGAVLKKNKFGKWYDATAGFRRNVDMAEYAAKYGGSCIIVWDGASRGTASMRDLALKYKLPLYLAKVKVSEQPLWRTTHGRKN